MVDKTNRDKTTPGPPGQDRLDGWKRITAYLNRDVRTLRRWEKNEGLPIHRLQHHKLATVYAYRSELDAWLAQRAQAPATPKSSGGIGRRWLWVLAVVLLAAVGAFLFRPGGHDKRVIDFGRWDWVLITQFDNRTGEARLDGSVEYALQRELANSRYVKVAPRERINDALRLMKLPLDSPIDVKTGREISLRDGGIRMLVTGRIEKLAETYQISVELVNPADGVTMASFSTDAGEPNQILSQIGDLAAKVRRALGEDLASIEASQAKLAKVTTPSLEALRLYSDADQILASTERKRALPVLEQAVRIDPDFASAHLLLWYALKDRDEMPLAEKHLLKAVKLADQTSERERLFILASYYFGYLHDTSRAIETYQLLLRLHPDHYWATGNLGNIFESLGRLREAYPYRLRMASWRPNLWFAQYDAVQFAIVNHDDAARDKYLARTEALPDKNPYLKAGLKMLPALEDWVNGDYADAARYTDQLVAATSPDELVNDDDGWLFVQVRSMYLALGKLARFRELTALRKQKGWYEALLDFDNGNPATLEEYLKGQTAGFWTATLLALDGQVDRARAAIDDPHSVARLGPYRQLRAWKNQARGQLALAEGRYKDAVSLLGTNTMVLNITWKDTYLFAMHALAGAYAALGETDKAVEVLQTASLQKPLTIFQPAATWMWLRNQAYLYRLLETQGREQAAADVATGLRDVLQLADPGHPVLQALEK